MAERVLTLRELNRATLARQLLLQRASLSALAAIERIAGLQGQLPNPPYLGLWSRLDSFQHADLTRLLEQRQVVRTTMMRNTLHLASAEDYLHLVPALRPLHTRSLDTYYSKRTIALEKELLLAAIQEYVQEEPRANFQLRARIAELVPDAEERLVYHVRTYLPLIQIFPGGVWNTGGNPAYTEAMAWLGRELAPPEQGLRHLIRRYLGAFGPASMKDMQVWSGLTRLQDGVHALRGELVIYRDERGRELFDLPDAPLPDKDTPAPVRFVPEFDNLVLSHQDRSRVVADSYRKIVFPGLSVVQATFLVDGFVAGTWRSERKASPVKLVIEPFEQLTNNMLQELQEEGERLMRWILEEKEGFEIQVSVRS